MFYAVKKSSGAGQGDHANGGVFFDGTGNNRANSDDLRLAYAHCAGLIGEERARACAKYEKHARALRDPHKSALINQHHIAVGFGEVIKNGA
jgi:hypothetical protein